MLIVFPESRMSKGSTLLDDEHKAILHNIEEAISDLQFAERESGGNFQSSIGGLEYVLMKLAGNT